MQEALVTVGTLLHLSMKVRVCSPVWSAHVAAETHAVLIQPLNAHAHSSKWGMCTRGTPTISMPQDATRLCGFPQTKEDRTYIQASSDRVPLLKERQPVCHCRQSLRRTQIMGRVAYWLPLLVGGGLLVPVFMRMQALPTPPHHMVTLT